MPIESLDEFLDNKPLYYDEIDYTRMPRIFASIKESFLLPRIIHIVGTNGKGTTGRFLSCALQYAGFFVGHYTSPHIVRFNERIWLNGNDIDDETLEAAHRWLHGILGKQEADSLSYFEYTTLLAMKCFKRCDFVVLEAGLGGEYDATAVFPSELTIATVIDKDHQAFLGESIAEIATTKLNAAKNNLLLAKQKHSVVYDIAKKVCKQKGVPYKKVQEFLDENDAKIIEKIAHKESLPSYLKENLSTALAALKMLQIPYNASSFANARLFGRLNKITENIVVDVGHNPLAAASIREALDGEKYVLVYNSFKDKDILTILSILKPILKRVEIIKIEGERAQSRDVLQKTLNQLKIQYEPFHQIKQKERYLVFGSFSVVEEFLKHVYA